MEKVGSIQMSSAQNSVAQSAQSCKPQYVRVQVKYDEDNPMVVTVNVNPLNCEKNIHKFISQLCQVLNHKYEAG
jgi:hypothetical protein